MNNDTYAQNEETRFQHYTAAFESPEAKAWVASLTAEQRKEAENRGLLAPADDKAGNLLSLEGEIASSVPIEEPSIGTSLTYLQQSPRKLKALQAFIHHKKHGAELKWAALRYLCGDGSCQSHADHYGMSKQNFHNIAVQVKTFLDSLDN